MVSCFAYKKKSELTQTAISIEWFFVLEGHGISHYFTSKKRKERNDSRKLEESTAD